MRKENGESETDKRKCEKKNVILTEDNININVKINVSINVKINVNVKIYIYMRTNCVK